jgi:transcriptional regulator with XRE-family HTH domain
MTIVRNLPQLLETIGKMCDVETHSGRDWTRADFTEMTIDQRKEVAQQIAAERKGRNITQEDLARLAGLPARTISNLETGRTPRAQTLRKLAQALDSSLRGKPDDASAVQMFTDATAPMYLQLSQRGRAQALREVVLLLGAALDRDQAAEQNDPENS